MENMSLKKLDFDNNKKICRTCMFIDEYSLNVREEGEIPCGYDGIAVCGIYDEEKDDGECRDWFISPCWKACSKYKRCTERQADYLDIFDSKTNSIIENPHKLFCN